MHPAINPIMFKGFMLGYLHKSAAGEAEDTYGKDIVTNAINDAAAPKKENAPGTGVLDPNAKDDVPATPDGYGALGEQLKGMWPGAAAGAIGTGAASIGVDSLRGQPPNIKRAILLSLLLGIPLGAAGQMGIMGGTDAYKQFGSNVASAGRKGLSDVLKQWGKTKEWGGQQIDKGKAMVSKVKPVAKAALKGGGPAAVKAAQTPAQTPAKTPAK